MATNCNRSEGLNIVPHITVVVPIFNVEDFLQTCLNSLAEQTLQSIEFILVDDCSTDQSGLIAQQWSRSDKRFELIRHDNNRGLSAARNSGLEAARGEWVCFVDSDDWIGPKALENLLAAASSQQPDMVVGNGFAFIGEPQNILAKPLFKRQLWGQWTSGPNWIVHATQQEEWPHYAWLQLVRRDFIQRLGARFVKDLIHEDIIWTVELALQADKIYFLNEPFYGYRQSPASIVGCKSAAAAMRRASSYIAIIARLADFANKAENKVLKQALLLQCNAEAGHLLGLMRKQIDRSEDRQHLAQNFFEASLWRPIWGGVRDIHSLWRAVRCCILMQRERMQLRKRVLS